ncbi:FtsJ-like methyltransferase-domain-containing protein [Aspergillus stella-maris]|uniref:FtsJ-like methyltransferase-domain-containing protein n=1 Tax=Aspergillus stella-maris TaxID=1810926 RepID=UPI003CCD9084
MKLEMEDDYQKTLETLRFEKEYVQVQAHTAQLLETERDRVHRMEQLLLRIENENLRLQMGHASQEMIQAKEREANTRFQLDDATREISHLQAVTQASHREMESLRRELTSLNTIASDSQKLQAEKARLSKEVSSIQSEVEKLRSDGLSANSVLAEKQAIARQLNALEVQLENEKRAHERALAKQAQQAEDNATLASKLEETKRELAEAQQYAKYEMPPGGRIHMSRPSPIQGKRGATNFVAAEDRNQEGTPAQQQGVWNSTTTKVPVERPTGNHLSKLTNRPSSELTIATPGAVRAKGLPKKSSTLPGEKSAFSITPFLNRTTGLAESSASSDDELTETRTSDNDVRGGNLAMFAQQRDPTVAKQPKLAKRGPIETDMNVNTKERQKQKVPESPDGTEIPLSRPVGQKQTLSKKRKLGLQRDRSLFDEDEDDGAMHETRKLGRKLVALTRTKPNGRVLGVDIIPSQPPKGVSTIQGNFLDLEVQAYVRDFVRNPRRGRPFVQGVVQEVDNHAPIAESVLEASSANTSLGASASGSPHCDPLDGQRTVDVVLSDMSAPWLQTTGFWKRSLSNPYNRMMNTSGLAFRDHAGSMDLCRAALEFSYEVLRVGGHFVCKFYQGTEDKDLEKQLKVLFQKVHRLKPESSRSESKEAFFIGLDRKPHAKKQEVLTIP